MTKFLISSRTDALGSRLLNVIHGWRAAKVLGVEYFVDWQKYWSYYDSDCPLKDFFDFSGVSGVTVQENLEETLKLKRHPELVVISKHAKEKIIPIDAPAYLFHNTKPTSLIGETAEEAESEAWKLVCSVNLNSKIHDAMEKIRERICLSDYAAVHIRRGDIVTNLELYNSEVERKHSLTYYQRFVDVPSYANAIASNCPDTPLFVFSNDESQISELISLAQVPVVTVNDIADILTELSPVQRDFIEMIIMSECKIIIGAKGSNFSNFAALYGNVKIVSALNWVIPKHTISAIESAFPGSHRVLANIFEGYSNVFRKQREISSLFLERSAFHSAQIKDSCSNTGKLPGIRVHDGLMQLRGNGVLYRQLLSDFVNDYESVLTNIQQAIRVEDYLLAEQFTYRLEKSSAKLCADELQSHAQSLIASIRQRSDISASFVKCREALAQVINSIHLIQKL